VEPTVIGSLAGLGAAGAVIIALLLTQKAKAEADKEAALLKAAAEKVILDRFDKIVDRLLVSEEANRQQIRELSESNRTLFDRVIGICMELSNSIKELSSGARANEKAITELRAELRSLAGPAQPKALGHEEPRPFGPG
jgi:DNA replication initiation complex subunit (GINS family)